MRLSSTWSSRLNRLEVPSVSTLQIALLGMAGGLLPDTIRVFRERYDPAVPSFLKSTKFYLSLALGLGLGALAAVILQASTAKEAIIYGFAAPELLTRVASGALPLSEGRARHAARPGTGAAPPTLRDWWTK
jgi:hypothetical protein